jgi:hypothetical protein
LGFGGIGILSMIHGLEAHATKENGPISMEQGGRL